MIMMPMAGEGPHSPPSMWSTGNPHLQIAWDATSFSSLMKCPRRYWYEIIQGWREAGKVDLEFGGFFASAVETYKKARLNGKDKQGATLEALTFTLLATWTKPNLGHDTETQCSNATEGNPWGGEYSSQWRCTGSEPYRNNKGNRAKCPYSLKGKWHPGEGPGVCGVCGSPAETAVRWVPADKLKDRLGLIRLVVGYCDEQPENLDTESAGIKPYAFPDGTPATELSFAIPTPWKSPHDDTYLLAGHLDSIGTVGETEHFITDNKTTSKPLTDYYFSQYSPNVQVDLYDLVGNLLFPELKTRGVIIEAAQILQGGARFASKPFYRTEQQREEFWTEIEWWIRQAERYAADNYWPMNRTACFLCPFKSICSKEPGKREMYLEGNFQKRIWNPLNER